MTNHGLRTRVISLKVIRPDVAAQPAGAARRGSAGLADLEAGADACMATPFASSALVETIERMLASRTA